jgi:flagellar biosynthesis/type III secretory pathway chaperone
MGQDLLFDFESVLVREFRQMQSLMSLTRSERQALVDGDTQRLLDVTERKEALLDQLGAISRARQAAQDALLQAGLQIDRPAASLLEGVHTLQAQVRSMAQSNSLLATFALQASTVQQAGLLSDASLQLPALLSALLSSCEPPTPATAPLLERITTLVHQQTAFRAALKVCDRTLSV